MPDSASTTGINNHSIDNYVTVILVTHFTKNENYGELSPPASDLVETTVRSLWENVGGIKAANHHLYYNYPTGNRPAEADAYGENLRTLSGQLGIGYHQHPNHGLRETLEDILKDVSTPYVFFLEHDWKFLSNIDLNAVLRTFEQHDDVNHIRFNKRPNETAIWDTIVEEDHSKPIPLCKVSTRSNNPHIARTSVFRQWVAESSPSLRYWYRALRQDTTTGGKSLRDIAIAYYRRYWLNHAHVREFDDIEQVISTKYKHQIEKRGFAKAHNRMGTYLYGSKGSGPYVSHLGRRV